MEAMMNMISDLGHAAMDAFPQLLDGLRVQLGCSDVEALADRILEAEEADFHWQSRIAERHLGFCEWADEEGEELDRVAIVSVLRGAWHVAICMVDGDENVQALQHLRRVESWTEAEQLLAEAK